MTRVPVTVGSVADRGGQWRGGVRGRDESSSTGAAIRELVLPAPDRGFRFHMCFVSASNRKVR